MQELEKSFYPVFSKKELNLASDSCERSFNADLTSGRLHTEHCPPRKQFQHQNQNICKIRQQKLTTMLT
jgi:hypothetical protein